MSDSSILAALDVGTSKVVALVAQPDARGAYRVLGAGVEPSRGIRKGTVVDVEQASHAIAAALDKAQRTAAYEFTSAFVSLAGAQVGSVNSRGVAGIASGASINQDDIDRAIDAAQAIAIPHGREVLHIIPRNFAVDGQEGIRQPIGMHGFRLEVETHIVTAGATSVQNLTKCVEAARLDVEAYVLNPLASAEAVLTDTEKEMGVLVCDLGGGTTDLAIYIEGNVWHTNVLPVGGNHITSDIAHLLRLPADVAERVKLEYGNAAPADVPRADTFTVHPFGEDHPADVLQYDLALIIEARVEEIFSLVLQEIKRTGYDGLLPAGIVLTGGGAQLPGIRKVASNVLNLPCRIGAPTQLAGLVDKIQGPAYATAAGLLIWAHREGMAAPRARRRRSSLRGMDLSKGLEFFKRLLP